MRAGHMMGTEGCELVVLGSDACHPVRPGRAGLVLVLRGTVQVVAREGRFELGRGQWLAYDTESRASLATTGSARALLLEAAEARLSSLPAVAAIALPNRGALTRELLRRLRHARRTAAHEPDADDSRLDRLLHILLSRTPTVASCTSVCPGRTRARRRIILSRLQRVRLFLEGNAERVVRLDELSRLSHFSAWYLSRTFRRLYGAPPQAYGVEVRLQRARRLVLAGAGAICDIAAACGFDNPSAFARAFHARFGTTASELRRAAAGAGSGGQPRRSASGAGGRWPAVARSP